MIAVIVGDSVIYCAVWRQPNCDLCFVIKRNAWWQRTFLPMATILALHHKHMKLVKPFTPYVTAWTVRKAF